MHHIERAAPVRHAAAELAAAARPGRHRPPRPLPTGRPAQPRQLNPVAVRPVATADNRHLSPLVRGAAGLFRDYVTDSSRAFSAFARQSRPPPEGRLGGCRARVSECLPGSRTIRSDRTARSRTGSVAGPEDLAVPDWAVLDPQMREHRPQRAAVRDDDHRTARVPLLDPPDRPECPFSDLLRCLSIAPPAAGGIRKPAG